MRGLVLKLREISEYKEFENKHLCCEECGAPADYVVNSKELHDGSNIRKMNENIYYCKNCLVSGIQQLADEINNL